MVQEMQAEIQILKIEVAGIPRTFLATAMKEATLVPGIKDWKGDSRGCTVHKFFAQINIYCKSQ
jgi:hypothetical protein